LRHGASLLLAYSIRKDMRQKEGEPSEPSFLRRAPKREPQLDRPQTPVTATRGIKERRPVYTEHDLAIQNGNPGSNRKFYLVAGSIRRPALEGARQFGRSSLCDLVDIY